MTFKERKSEVLRIAKEKRACKSEYARAEASTTMDELLKVIADNAQWCVNAGISLEGITEIPGWLNLSGCDLTGITLPTKIGGSIDLRWCDLTGITLPTKIGGWLDLRGCENLTEEHLKHPKAIL